MYSSLSNCNRGLGTNNRTAAAAIYSNYDVQNYMASRVPTIWYMGMYRLVFCIPHLRKDQNTFL